MVSTALYTGLSGLRLHQSYIDVIGNNLANVSTPGFRGSRPTFSDILSFTVRAGSGPSGNFGGLNPMQLGHGAIMSSVDTNTTQGTFSDTGRPLDVAIEGHGFFTLTDGNQQFYTRVGTFGVDANRNLVDVRTGYRVMASSGANIDVPVADTLPARATSQISFQGNLPAEVGGPLAEIWQSAAALKAGTAATKPAHGTAGTGNQFDLTGFIGKTLLVSVNGGAQRSITIDNATFGSGPVAASVVADKIKQLHILDANADDVAGTISFETVKLGDTATLKFDEGAGSTGLLAALGLDAMLKSGSESVADGNTDIGKLTARQDTYANGDRIIIRGNNPDGTAFSDTFVYGPTGSGFNGTTMASLVSFINDTMAPGQALAELTTDGHIRVTSDTTGTANMSISIGEQSGNGGQTNWPSFTETQAGTGADTAVTSIDVVDSQGRAHTVTMTFTRTVDDPTVWDLTSSMNAGEGTISQASIGSVRFNANGSFNVIGGGSNTLTFSFNGISGAQDVAVNLGTSGAFDGVSMMGNDATVAATDQDGWGPGTLLNIAFSKLGELTGYYSNGQSQVMAQLRLSVFPNEGGLMKMGDTLWVESPNSDNAIATIAGAAGAGSIRAGQLENSNVDIASEFVSLIEAQRGFQANSRVITAADQILSELINIVR